MGSREAWFAQNSQVQFLAPQVPSGMIPEHRKGNELQAQLDITSKQNIKKKDFIIIHTGSSIMGKIVYN